jgi:hypothetical protein
MAILQEFELTKGLGFQSFLIQGMPQLLKGTAEDVTKKITEKYNDIIKIQKKKKFLAA